MITPLVSIIIPCYNAVDYIKSTIQSILNQSETNFEIIIINDGSTDNSTKVINEFSDKRIQLFHQKNQGVSTARNHGLKIAKGEFIVFFDADDVMSQDFLFHRLKCLQKNKDISYACGEVKPFLNNKEFTGKKLIGAVNNIYNEVLMYDSTISTCPSNYMFNTDSLKKHQLQFNPLISSHADRFFLLEIENKKLKGILLKDKGELYYRIQEHSMSHKLNNSLATDAETYYSELIKHNLISSSINKKVLAKGFYIISGTYYKLKNHKKALIYAMKSFLISPSFFIKNIT